MMEVVNFSNVSSYLVQSTILDDANIGLQS